MKASEKPMIPNNTRKVNKKKSPVRINRDDAVALIKSGKFCSVTFIKRSDNKLRKLTGRSGVSRYLKGKAGSGPAYNPKDKGLLTFYDVREAGYKSIPIERIIIVNGHTVV